MTKAPEPMVLEVVEVLERAFPHPLSLRAFLADHYPTYLQVPSSQLYRVLAEDLLNRPTVWSLGAFGRLIEHRSMLSPRWILLATFCTGLTVTPGSFEPQIKRGLRRLISTIADRCSQAMGERADATLHELELAEAQVEALRLVGDLNEQHNRLRRQIQSLRDLWIDIVQLDGPSALHPVERIVPIAASYYFSGSRPWVWLDDPQGPAGRGALAEFSTNIVRLGGRLYRLLILSPEDLTSGRALQAGFYVWLVALGGSSEDSGRTEARFHVLQKGESIPDPVGILGSGGTVLHLGRRGNFLSVHSLARPMCPHRDPVFQDAPPIEDLWRQAA